MEHAAQVQVVVVGVNAQLLQPLSREGAVVPGKRTFQVLEPLPEEPDPALRRCKLERDCRGFPLKRWLKQMHMKLPRMRMQWPLVVPTWEVVVLESIRGF